jgi:hypothetical protein
MVSARVKEAIIAVMLWALAALVVALGCPGVWW